MGEDQVDEFYVWRCLWLGHQDLITAVCYSYASTQRVNTRAERAEKILQNRHITFKYQEE